MLAAMKLATWNVNSIGMRMPRIVEFLRLHQPDVLCVQETKTTEAAFPHEALAAEGYVAADNSSGRWAGVAVIARSELGLQNVVRGLPDDPIPEDARWVEADVAGVRVVSVYVPNGRTLDDPMYGVKLAFLEAMARRADELAGTSLIIAGDYNIAPADLDVYDPVAFIGGTHVSEPERERLRAILDRGLLDAYRCVAPETVQYTWWDYRAGHFHKGFGLRIDLALVSHDLASRLITCGIDRDFRKGKKPSDHAPVLIEFGDS